MSWWTDFWNSIFGIVPVTERSVALDSIPGVYTDDPVGTVDASTIQVMFLDPLYANIANTKQQLMEFFTDPVAQTVEWIDNLVTKWEYSVDQVKSFIDTLKNFDLEEAWLAIVRKLNNSGALPIISTGPDDEEVQELFYNA